jgi:phosphoribosylformylglycinamidine synthase
LQSIHRRKTGSPPRCNLEAERELQLVLRSLIYSGVVKSAHDCSDGGLAVALAECCISRQIARETPSLVGAQIDLSTGQGSGTQGQAQSSRCDALLFGETQGRIILSTSTSDAVKVVERARLLGISATRIGVVTGKSLEIKTDAGEFTWPVAELHDLWWNSIARAMR